LTEGGAGRLGLDLHTRLLDKGIESKIFYGYGSGAKRNPQDNVILQAHHLGRRDQVLGNYLIHRLIGIDILNPVGRGVSSLRSAVQEADIVHLHNIHSHFVPYAWLFEHLRDMNKKVVWTLHDSWVLTGRCAVPGTCERWRSGCGSCPLMANYPAAMVDLSAFESKRKRKQIGSLGDNLVFVGCAQWIAQRAQVVFPDHEVCFVHNGLDTEMEEQLRVTRDKAKTNEAQKARKEVVVIGADLSDSQQHNIELIQQIIKHGGCTVHAVGKYSPFKGPNVLNHGSISSRSRLAELYRHADATLFVSNNHFSLVLLESLSAGTPVLALDTPGSREVLSLIGARPVKGDAEMLSRVQRASFFDLYEQQSRDDLQDKALEIFSGNRMAEQYVEVYRSALNHVSV